MISQSIFKQSLSSNLKLALPLVGGQLGSVLVMVADNLMVAQLGTTELAAISLGLAIFSIIFVVGYGLSQGLPALVSENFSIGKYKMLSSDLGNSLIVNLSYSLLMYLLIELSIPLLYSLGQDPIVVEKAIPYLRLSALSMIPFMLFLAFKSFSDGIGRTSLGMIALTFGNILNILLNYPLIFGEWGFESMGVSGAGLSSLIARASMLIVWCLIAFNSNRYSSFLVRLNFNRIIKKRMRLLLSLGGITALQMLSEVSIFSVSTLMMGNFGKVPQAAHQVSLNIVTVSFMVASAFAMAGTIEVGKHFGKRNKLAMQAAGFSAISLAMVFMGISGILLWLGNNWLPRLYLADQESIEIASYLLIFAAIFQLSDGIQVSAISALRGLQDVKWPAVYTFVSYLVLGLPTAYVLAYTLEYGPAGIWIGLIVGLSSSAFLNSRRFWRLTKSEVDLAD